MIAVPVMSYNGFTPIVLVLWLLISPIKHRFVVAAKEEHTRMNEWALCYEAVRSGGSIVASMAIEEPMEAEDDRQIASHVS